MNDKPIHIVIVDDHPIVLQGFAFLLQSMPSICIAGSFTNAKDCLTFLSDHFTDIVLLDINLPDMNGIDLCAEIKKRSPYIRVIAISNNNERSIISRMLQSGASGYILKNASPEELVHCIAEALNGRLALSQDIQMALAQSSANGLSEIPRLTRREREILKMIASGKTTTVIATELFVSPLTVDTHRRNLMQKFGASNVAALIHKATEMRVL